jgi:hypothetical protein
VVRQKARSHPGLLHLGFPIGGTQTWEMDGFLLTMPVRFPNLSQIFTLGGDVMGDCREGLSCPMKDGGGLSICHGCFQATNHGTVLILRDTERIQSRIVVGRWIRPAEDSSYEDLAVRLSTDFFKI